MTSTEQVHHRAGHKAEICHFCTNFTITGDLAHLDFMLATGTGQRTGINRAGLFPEKTVTVLTSTTVTGDVRMIFCHIMASGKGNRRETRRYVIMFPGALFRYTKQ